MKKWLVVLMIMSLMAVGLAGCSKNPSPGQIEPSAQVTVTVVNMPAQAFVKGSAPKAVADLEIKPATKFIAGSTIEVTLKNAKWNQSQPTAEQNQGWTYGGLSNGDLTVRYVQAGEAGLDRLTLVLPGVQIGPAVPPGNLIVSLAGTAGAAGDYVVGKIAEGVKVTADKSVVKVSALAQPAGKIVIREVLDYGFNNAEDGSLQLTLPNGVNFSRNPQLFLDGQEIINIKVDDGGQGKNYIQWKGKAITDQFSDGRLEKIEIIEIYYDLDTRFTPQDITVEVSGQVLTGPGGSTDTIAAVTNASASSLTSGSATFVVGSTKAVINGKTVTMDVAPYKSNDRFYLPLRYAANALAISESGIIWDQVNQTVTLMKGNNVAQVRVGSTTMLLNGMSVNMDVSPQLVDQRLMLPITWVAQALGAAVNWDEATQTATLLY